MFTGNTLPQISRPAMYRKGHGYIAPNSPHTAVMSRFISFPSMRHQQQCADTTSSEPSVREAAAAKAPPHTSASPAAVCSYRYYSFAAAALSSTHLQHHFCISKITYSAGLRRFELHITNGGSPPCGELPFSSILLFLTHSVSLQSERRHKQIHCTKRNNRNRRTDYDLKHSVPSESNR